MSIESSKNIEIPSFNPESFMSEDNKLSTGLNIQRPFSDNNNDYVNESENESESEIKEELSYDDDFLMFKDEDEDEDEDEFKSENYSDLSKMLGVEINSKEDLEAVQSKFKKEESNNNVNENNYNFSDDESKSFQTLNDALSATKSSSPEDLMKWHLKQVNRNSDYENNPEELDYHIDTLKETGMFDSQEKDIRAKLIKEIGEQKDSLIDGASHREEEASIVLNKELEKEIKVYQKGFHGVNINPKDAKDVFDSIRNGSIFNEIESNQANVAEMGLLWKNRELFYKAFENPNPSVGVKKIIDELQNAKAKPAAGRQTFKNPLVFDPDAFLASDGISISKN